MEKNIKKLLNNSITFITKNYEGFQTKNDFADELKTLESLQLVLAVASQIPHDAEINAMAVDTKEECIACINKILQKYPQLMQHENLLRMVAICLHKEKLDEDTKE